MTLVKVVSTNWSTCGMSCGHFPSTSHHQFVAAPLKTSQSKGSRILHNRDGILNSSHMTSNVEAD
jgi:hypothetical protein